MGGGKSLKNAADAMQGEGEIEVNMIQVNQISILIKDSGKGIPSKMHKTIFELIHHQERDGVGFIIG